MTSLRLSKDVSKRSKIETKGKKRKRKDYTSKWQGCVWSLLIYRGQEQDRWGWELVEKGTGSRRFWPPCPPPPPPSHLKLVSTRRQQIVPMQACTKKPNILGYTCQVSMTDAFSLLVDSSCFTSLGVQVQSCIAFAYLQFWTFLIWRN